jgi:hypothetical protein
MVVMVGAPGAQKNPPTFIRRRTIRGDFLFKRIALPHIDPLGQGTLPSPTAGSRIWFPRPLLMLERYCKQRGRSVNRQNYKSVVIDGIRKPLLGGSGFPNQYLRVDVETARMPAP